MDRHLIPEGDYMSGSKKSVACKNRQKLPRKVFRKLVIFQSKISQIGHLFINRLFYEVCLYKTYMIKTKYISVFSDVSQQHLKMKEMAQ